MDFQIMQLPIMRLQIMILQITMTLPQKVSVIIISSWVIAPKWECKYKYNNSTNLIEKQVSLLGHFIALGKLKLVK